ncbi:MAG: O-antigen ligase family protein [Deltaproteobacteria bacterium]|nr:O-antigen ligase family protein [Deltaproteobacteria bacterium]
MSRSIRKTPESRFDPYFTVILFATLIVPVFVLPYVLDNPFNTPKSVVMLLGALLMIGMYLINIFRGMDVLIPKTSTHIIILTLIALNLFSFIYTQNYFFTIVAALLNITCLIFFYFASLHMDGKKAFLIFMIATASGILVSIDVWSQYYGKYLLMTWVKPGKMIMGTIGNSNYLGAYLIFPLYMSIGLVLLLRKKVRLAMVILSLFMMIAFLFSRARASWMGFFSSLPVFLVALNEIHGKSVREYLRSHKRKIIGITVVSLGILVALWFMAPPRFHKMMRFEEVTESETLRLRVTKYFRPSIWLFKQSPLFGTGLWSYRNMVYKAQAEINRSEPGFFDDYPDPKPRRAHNDYLEILNDGGLVAAAVLLLFFITVMRHGWVVIKNPTAHDQDRIIAATAFSSLVAIMIAATLFFPFRVNSTMFMTVLMMGVLEGLYLKNQGLISKRRIAKTRIGLTLFPMICLLLIGIGWYGGIRPFKGELEHFQYKMALKRGDLKGAERHILKAIDYAPLDSMYHTVASQLYLNLKKFPEASDYAERAIIGFNGDLTLWSVWYLKGVLEYQKGSLLGAKAAFEKALYYYPLFDPAKERLKDVDAMIKRLKPKS